MISKMSIWREGEGGGGGRGRHTAANEVVENTKETVAPSLKPILKERGKKRLGKRKEINEYDRNNKQ